MAGLVGLLRQLGDLAEFASEIFHELHKEVMVTATRGHKLILRVQQVESEIPSVEKAFLCQSRCTHFTYNMGINWHSRLQMDQNLVIRDGMPQFMMDSYEECHDPPQLSMLDKYDAAGAGACLRRYSNPFFFKTKLASSGIVESQAERENRVHKHMKKGHWSNGANPEIFSARHFYSKLQSVTYSQASEELPVIHVKLNSRLSKGSDTTSYIEHLCQVLALEENCASNNAGSCSPIKMKPIASVNDHDRADRRRINAEGLVGTQPMHEKCIEGGVDNYSSNKLKINSSALQEIDQKETSSDDDWRTEGSSGGYRSDETSSDVDNYVDAQNTIESELETDSENNVKPNLSFTTVTQRMNSITDDEPELQAQNSRVDFYETSNLVGFGTSCKTDETHEKVPEKLSNCEFDVDSFEGLCFRGKHTFKVSPISPVSELAEELCNCSVADSHSLLKHSSSSGHSSTTQSASIHWNGMSGFVETSYGVVKDSDGSLPRISDKSTSSLPTNNELFRRSAKGSTIFSDASSDIASQAIAMGESCFENKCFHDYSEGLVSEKEPQEHNDVSSTKVISPCSWKGDVCSEMRRPFKVPSPSKDAVHAETVALVKHSSIHNAVTEADSENDGPCLVLLPAASGVCACSQEESIPESVVLDQNNSQITKGPIPMNLTGTNEVCTPHIPFTSLIEGQFSNSELNDSDFSHSDAKLTKHCFHTILSKHADKDLHPNNSKRDCTDRYGIDKDIASEDTICCNEESKREMVQSSQCLGTVAEPFEEALEQQAGGIPNLISFERYLSLKKDGNQNNPSGGFPKLSDSTCEPEYHGTENGISFAEFLKLTQMDFLLTNKEDASVDPVPSERVFRSKASSKPSQESLSLSPNPIPERSNPFREPSRLQDSNETSMVSLNGNGQLRPSGFAVERVQFWGQTNAASNSTFSAHKLSRVEFVAEPCLVINNGVNLSPSNTSQRAQQLLDGSVSSQCSSLHHVNFFPSKSSDTTMQTPPDFSLSNPESNPEPVSIQQYSEPESICLVIDNAFQETSDELLPLPPLPPLEWRMVKRQIGHLTSNSNEIFSRLPVIDMNPSNGFLQEREAAVQKSTLLEPLPQSEVVTVQCDSWSLERDSMQSLNLSRIHENGTLHLEESAAHTPDPSSDQSNVEEDNHLYILQESNRGKVHPLNPFLLSEGISSEHSLRPQLGQQLSSSESKSSQHNCSSLEKEMGKTTGPFCSVSAHENDGLQTEYETPRDLPLEDSSFSSDSLIMHMLADEKPKKKLSLLHRPRDPLIEDVASHDKSTLRKVPEPIHPSVKSKTDESNTILEQIRNKSQNLKPTSGVKPNLRGPPTNLKIAAILEKANAIRQACVGSDDDDDDDDGDGWSDS